MSLIFLSTMVRLQILLIDKERNITESMLYITFFFKTDLHKIVFRHIKSAYKVCMHIT